MWSLSNRHVSRNEYINFIEVSFLSLRQNWRDIITSSSIEQAAKPYATYSYIVNNIIISRYLFQATVYMYKQHMTNYETRFLHHSGPQRSSGCRQYIYKVVWICTFLHSRISTQPPFWRRPLANAYKSNVYEFIIHWATSLFDLDFCWAFCWAKVRSKTRLKS